MMEGRFLNKKGSIKGLKTIKQIDVIASAWGLQQTEWSWGASRRR